LGQRRGEKGVSHRAGEIDIFDNELAVASCGRVSQCRANGPLKVKHVSPVMSSV